MPNIAPTVKALLFALCICLLTACSPAAVPPTATARAIPTSQASATVSTECAAGTHINTLISNGETREYRLYVPSSYQPSHPTPLILGFHGNTDHATSFEAYSKFSPLAEHANFIVVYMQGAGNPPTWSVWHDSIDVQYVRDVLDTIQSICNIDKARIYASGHSLGGGMVDQLACDLADRIAAIGTQAGAYLTDNSCKPSQPIPVIAIHGTGDTVIYYNGIPPGGDTPSSYYTIGTPIPQWASRWANRNGCDAKSTLIFEQGSVSGQQWSHCRNGADVAFYTVRDGGHGWPTPAPSFDAAQTIWDFFVKHPLTP